MNQHMLRPRHSPGPWYADGAGIGIYYESGIQRVATVEGGRRSADERIANARLIAASPVLYERLKECLPLLGWSDLDESELAREVRLGNEMARVILRVRVALAAVEKSE